jgi:membrane protein DedA with SNARE-associated domain
LSFEIDLSLNTFMLEHLISILAHFIINGINALGYYGVAGMMAIESACVPLPSEIIMPFAGYLVSQGQMTLLGASIAGALGCVVGSVLAYAVGYYGGRVAIEKYGKYILISHHDLDIADKFFTKYGSSAIFFSRLMPVVRTFISLPAGIARMNFTKFVIYTFVGSVPWCFALSWIGMKLGEHWDTLGGYFHKFDFVIVILLVIGIAWYVWRHIKQNKKLEVKS